MDRYILVDDKGEMLAVGFSKEEQKLIEKDPEAFKRWAYKNEVK